MIPSTAFILGGIVHDAVVRAGYGIISNRSPSCAEIAGNGNWEMLRRACRRFVFRDHSGRSFDHVTIVVRSENGTRELRDVGLNQVRRAPLPATDFHWKPSTREFYGVYPRGDQFRARIKVWESGWRRNICLGTYATAIEAAVAREAYVIEHGVHAPLNFPVLVKMA